MIMEAAAKSNLKRVSLELGGKSPIVVFPDVDCKFYFRSLLNGLIVIIVHLMDSGQSCRHLSCRCIRKHGSM